MDAAEDVLVEFVRPVWSEWGIVFERGRGFYCVADPDHGLGFEDSDAVKVGAWWWDAALCSDSWILGPSVVAFSGIGVVQVLAVGDEYAGVERRTE